MSTSVLPRPVHAALDYLLATIGDHHNEGEAAKLRASLAELADTPLHEDPPARVSDERGTPEERLKVAEAQLNAAQAARDAAAAAAGKTPAGTVPVPTTEDAAKVDEAVGGGKSR